MMDSEMDIQMEKVAEKVTEKEAEVSNILNEKPLSLNNQNCVVASDRKSSSRHPKLQQNCRNGDLCPVLCKFRHSQQQTEVNPKKKHLTYSSIQEKTSSASTHKSHYNSVVISSELNGNQQPRFDSSTSKSNLNLSRHPKKMSISSTEQRQIKSNLTVTPSQDCSTFDFEDPSKLANLNLFFFPSKRGNNLVQLNPKDPSSSSSAAACNTKKDTLTFEDVNSVFTKKVGNYFENRKPKGNPSWNAPSRFIQPPTFSSRKTELGQYRGPADPVGDQYQGISKPQTQQNHYYQKLNQRELHVVEKHKYDMKTISEEIEVFKNLENFEIVDKTHKGTLKAMQNRLSEMASQLHVFEEMRKRAFKNLRQKDLHFQLLRETYRLQSRLPALAKRLEIEEHLENNSSRFIIIQGQTGSGKSTQVAQYIADHPKFLGKKIICTQPRKIAAISLANRVSMEYSGGSHLSKPGYEIGYHVGGQKLGRKNTRIEFVTEGVMLERIMKGVADYFKNVGCIVLDEAHERSIICDILLGSFKKEDPRWKDIKIVVTSATIDLVEFSQFFNNAPTVKIEGKSFPIDLIYHPISENPDIRLIRNEVVNVALEMHEHCAFRRGDILCFLPGQEDVILAKEQFEAESKKFKTANVLQSAVFVLFGRQDPEQQAEVFKKLPENIRKIIFATDVAETSITIDGVVYVVDSGVKKEIVFDPKRNISSLRINTISRSSAIQRAGRSGRTQPGECHRLYSKEDFESMSMSTAPEIFKKPLSLAILSLREMNIVPQEFDWISAPSIEAIKAAEEELHYLGAVHSDHKPNELGKLISQCQQEPKLVRMIYRGCQDGFGMAAITIASILTVSNMFFWTGIDQESKTASRKKRNSFAHPDGDVVTMYRVFQKYLEIRERKTDNTEADHQSTTTEEEKDNTVINENKDDVALALPKKPIEKLQLTLTNSRKLAADWCRENSINGKALGLVISAKLELLSVFRQTDAWKKQVSQSNEPSNLNLKRLIFSGYFLNTARLIHTRKSRSPQYFALHSDVMGNLDFKAALVNHGQVLTGIELSPPPQWIVFEKILRISSTLFPTSTSIEESWIQEESPEFYDFCVAKSLSLPTEKIIKQTSQQCLRSIFGKFCSNMTSLELELDCSLDVDIEAGILAAYCSPMQKSQVELKINEKISRVLQELINDVIEEEYLGGTRVVLGQGYKVREVLFPQEYTTLYIRRLHSSLNQKELNNFIVKSLMTGKFNFKDTEGIRSIEVNEFETSNSGVIKFFSKAAARAAYEQLQGEMYRGQRLEIVPAGVGPKRGVTQAESCKLKISWPIGYSDGTANICFTSASNANTFIDNVSFLLPGARVSRVHGESNKQKELNFLMSQKRGKKPLPPSSAIRFLVKPSPGTMRFRFDIIPELDANADFDYKVTVADIRKDIDEQDIITRVKPSIPKWVKVNRMVNKEAEAACIDGLLVEDRMAKLKPLEEFITTNTVTSDFFDRNLLKAGIYVYFEDPLTVQKAYRKADYTSMESMFLQPHRFEIAYNHCTSIHIDLFKFLKEDIQKIKDTAYKKGLTVSERIPTNSKAKFVHLSFRSVNAKLIREVQEKLEEISNCTKFYCENMDRLFTWTGRLQMEKLAEKAFIHWNTRNYGIWIYGEHSVRQEISTQLQKVAEDLSKLEVFDKPFIFNKKKIDLVGKKAQDSAKVTRICISSKVDYFHFIGNRVFVSGSKASVDTLQEALEKNEYLFKKFPSKFAKSGGRPNCGLCFTPPDGPFILSSVCNHAFCVECIEPMFEIQPPQFPVTCQECKMELSISDISKCAQKGALRKFLEVAVSKYQEEHSTSIFMCPKPDCQQLLSADAKKIGEYGGEFYFCDECVTTYCLPCSNKMAKPIKSHEYDNCDDIQNGPSNEVREHVKRIQETIFNLSCPRCQTVFYEFTGCAAVTCETCKAAFCGLCLKDCDNDAHPHVMSCPKNPKKDFFVSETDLNRVHKAMRVQKLRECFQSMSDQTTRDGVLRIVRRDLIDHRIDASEII